MPITIERVTSADTALLRHKVLRPHETIEELVRSGVSHRWAAHFAAIDDNVVIGTAWVAPEAPPWPCNASPSWRLRGMATEEKRRGGGVGTAVLGAVIDHVRGEGGRLLWCNARIPAMSLYQRAGFVARGERWEDPMIGPHIAMEMSIDDPGTPAL